MELTRLGMFIPTGAVHMIGTDAYAKLLWDHNQFLHTVTTVPIGDFQHETLDIPFSTNTTTNIEMTSLMDIFLEQPWCLSLERTTTPNKVLVVTTKGQLTAARACVDLNLPAIYKQQIMDKLDITTLQKIVPRRFDKPVTMAVSEAYATKLKQRTDIVTTGSNKPNTMNHPLDHNISNQQISHLPKQSAKISPNHNRLPPLKLR